MAASSSSAAPPDSASRLGRSTSLPAHLDAEAQPLGASPRSPSLAAFVARAASAARHAVGGEKYAYTRLGGDAQQRPLSRLLHLGRPQRRLAVVAATGVALLLLLLVGLARQHGDGAARENQAFATPMRALTPREAHDRTWGAAQCRREFPAFYPQLEELQRRFQAQGGISKQMLDASEKGDRELRWGLARVSLPLHDWRRPCSTDSRTQLIINDGQVFVSTRRAAASCAVPSRAYLSSADPAVRRGPRDTRQRHGGPAALGHRGRAERKRGAAACHRQ